MATTHDGAPRLDRDASPEAGAAPAAAISANKAAQLRLMSGSSRSASSSSKGSNRHSMAIEPSSRSSSYQSTLSEMGFSPNPNRANRLSTMSLDRPAKRRGYTRPQGTDFAASAKHRESVLSLGPIAHLQYYFSRTGLLDGKGGQLARKRHPRATLDLSSLDPSSYLNPNDADSSYASMGSSPNAGTPSFGGPMVDSPVDDDDDYSGSESDEYSDADEDMLPPTTSTYIDRTKPVPRPPTIEELKADLTQALDAASKVLVEAAPSAPGTPTKTPTKKEIFALPPLPGDPDPKPVQGWHEVQGMQVLDVMTLAIRAAKMYYTAHELPDRLDSIRSEKDIRSDLLSVMEVLKHMATRNFAGGAHQDEHQIMTSWIDGIRAMLRQEEEIEKAEKLERTRWSWLRGDWTGREIERELAFLASIDIGEAEPLPAYTPVEDAAELPTPFLASLQNGVRLVRLHNAAVKKSRRRFGAIGTFHTDTQKPYRCADNLRYWIKAAELRWELLLKVDVMGVVYNSGPDVWREFEAALWQWCRKVREEMTAEWTAEESAGSTDKNER
ncbi:hypothetical protein F4780DRAFT_526083 [Xylariomycetidae sp. FL0641]|nr:hypothetical protein F4780DRAFT_526083 [Xylariomycetidae sp. FL0641]